MNLNAVPVAVLAGISGFAALLFTGLYVSLANVTAEHSRREYLSFALMCGAVVIYDITCVGAYNAQSVEHGFFWMRCQLLAAACFNSAYSQFDWQLSKRPMPALLRVGNWVQGALAAVVAVWENELTLTVARPAIKRVRAFDLDIVYYEVESGAITQLMMLVFFAIYTTNGVYLARQFRSLAAREQRGQLGFLLASILSGLTATNDVLVAGGAYSFPYLLEYGVAAVLMAMCYLLLMRFGELHETVNSLNIDLTATNVDLVRALEQAQESSRSKTEFLASISHELRTPLNAIINLPEALLEQFGPRRHAYCSACEAEFELEDGEVLGAAARCNACGEPALTENCQLAFNGDADDAQACLRTVNGAARHLAGLVNDVLDASKLELGRTVISPSAFALQALLSEVVDSTQQLAGKNGVSVVLRATASYQTIGPIVADRIRIGQILYNLIGNAIKFSPDGGIVEVSLSAEGDEREICVRDQGIGIAEEHHSTIFEKFTQVDGGATRSFGGTGLGLAISKGLVEMHGGRIWVESRKGEGAAFFVRLPAPQAMQV